MRDDLVERTLAALGKVEAPEGLESRVLRGVERSLVALPPMSQKRDMGHPIWWRGVLSGAAFAVLVMGVGMVVRHEMRGPVPGQPGGGLVLTVADRTGPAPAGDRGIAGLAPCTGAGQGGGEIRARSGGGTPKLQEVAVGSLARSHPLPSPGLTFQERELVRLASKAKPEELAMLNPEVREKMAAQEAEEFQQFFTQPVRKVTEQVAEPAGGPVVEPGSEPKAEPTNAQATESGSGTN